MSATPDTRIHGLILGNVPAFVLREGQRIVVKVIDECSNELMAVGEAG